MHLRSITGAARAATRTRTSRAEDARGQTNRQRTLWLRARRSMRDGPTHHTRSWAADPMGSTSAVPEVYFHSVPISSLPADQIRICVRPSVATSCGHEVPCHCWVARRQLGFFPSAGARRSDNTADREAVVDVALLDAIAVARLLLMVFPPQCICPTNGEGSASQDPIRTPEPVRRVGGVVDSKRVVPSAIRTGNGGKSVCRPDVIDPRPSPLGTSRTSRSHLLGCSDVPALDVRPRLLQGPMSEPASLVSPPHRGNTPSRCGAPRRSNGH